MENPDLKTASTKSSAKVSVRKHFDPTRLLVLRDRLPWFWFAFTVAVLLLSAISTAINVMGMPPHYTLVIRGGLVLFAVLLDTVKTSIRRRYL